MKISYAIKDDKIVSSNNQANSGYANWLANNEHLEILEVETEDSLFFSSSNLKVESGVIVIDTVGIAERETLNKRNQYKQLVQEKISVNYSQGDEFEMSALGVQDKTDVLYIEYRERVATAIAEANTEVYGS